MPVCGARDGPLALTALPCPASKPEGGSWDKDVDAEHAFQPAGQKDGSGAAKKAVATQPRPSKLDK